MSLEVQVFDNLKVKQENGQVMFDAESAAIGLGIVDTSHGYENVRWERVNKYLKLSATSGGKINKGDFITEPQFYKLAIKANNETAERFQDWVTSEVLPSIRQTGGYQVKKMTNDEIVGQALRIEHDRAERLAVELSVTKPKAEMHDVFIEKGQAIGIREASKELNVKQNDLIDNLMNNGYVYRTKGHNGKLQPIKKYVPKYFVLKSASVNGVEFTPQMLITPQGREFFYKKFYAPDQIEMAL
ncbi:phage antirepressor KilAC domain-containing protein [Leuconostoc mesenteroides]|uniref:phage antirepressor KilAC domain-containing protein n=1 Tax=Leuconostoc mesenteroides TaxID=1245 RepID=UPI001CBAC792|nr:phage antirepressor KilAC domain-containing protein [Leuconostoc mesenteroides]MBZ1540191.1 phage antirepressor KilAC domain-containing protein [Leuconostoc mesenteroides]